MNQNRGQNQKTYRKFNDSNASTRPLITTRTETMRFSNRTTGNNNYENRLNRATCSNDDMRRMSRPAPDEMIRGMGRPLTGYRYVVIGDMWFWIDDGYRVHDAIHFEVNIDINL